jgi:hypothetical protein
MLIELIIVLVIIMGGVSLYFGMMRSSVPTGGELSQTGGASSTGDQPASLALKVEQRAQGVQCQQNIRQLRMMIGMEKDQTENGGYPPSLQAIRGAEQITQCPVGGEPYTYDPATGRVSCPHPGHENY